MIGGLPIPTSVLTDVAKNGSPFILRSVGRAFGLGDTEQAALAAGKVPIWLLIIAGVTVGVVVGVQVHKRWPNKVPKIIGG